MTQNLVFIEHILQNIKKAESFSKGLERNELEENELKQSLDEIDHKYEEAMALIDLNPIRARELLTEANELLTEQSKRHPNEKQAAEIETYVQKVNEGISFAIRKFNVSLEPFFELNLVKTQGEGDFMSLYKDALAIVDIKNKALYTLTIGTKASRIVAGGEELVKAKAVAVHGEDIFVLGDQIYAVNVNSKSLQPVIAADGQWGKLLQIIAYAGNIYLLDTDKNQVWKYPRIETGFGSLQKYLLADALVDFNDASSMAIDGSVWITHNGQILKFTLGEQEVRQISGLDEDLGSTLDIYLDDTTSNSYVHDISKKRIVVFDKDGEYLAQYHWSQDLNVSDFVASEVLKKILLLSRGTIYAIELK